VGMEQKLEGRRKKRFPKTVYHEGTAEDFGHWHREKGYGGGEGIWKGGNSACEF
jgi:hypothetical protein